ncbi:stage II sporulation protein M [[Clostridium] polysaccharolyticum]|uniref:Stage II sporulation protein M n=1 Tax=[Clostridium] polysaccharolyticum TaxID=29364 RepID=A0A1I0AED2_9FIRM|nr:stage II sporulation protein M [[Clostridium] polysaccharolyticum]SES91613.1 Stage II sporulation protein M [[Clostridium] polysaccharolyticum]
MFFWNKAKNKIGLLQKIMLEIIASFLLGIVIANLTKATYSSNSQYIDILVYLDLREVNRFQLLLFVMQSRIKDYLLIWLFSITVLAIPYNTLFLWYRGFTAGFVVCALSVLYGWKGTLCGLGLGMPHMLIYLVVFVQTVILSYKMHETSSNGVYTKRYRLFVKQLPAFFVLLSLTVIGCFMESFLNPVFLAWLKTALKLV